MAISGRRIPEGEEVARQITQSGASGLFVQGDVAREQDIIALVEETVRAVGALHIAFNNAGHLGPVWPADHRADNRALSSSLRREYSGSLAVNET